MLQKILTEVKVYAVFDSMLKLEGKQLNVILSPIKNKTV
jgi:translation initiation factor IF-3